MQVGVTHVVLVRHARPVIDPATPAGTSALADDARAAVDRLATDLARLGVDGVVTSPEPKAATTAAVIAAALDLPLSEDHAFREQGLDTLPWIAGQDAFFAAVRDHFARKDDAVLGDESSTMAAARFAAGVERARRMHTLPVVVTHGRVMCGYLRDVLGIDPMEVWATLRMPDALVVDLERNTFERMR